VGIQRAKSIEGLMPEASGSKVLFNFNHVIMSTTPLFIFYGYGIGGLPSCLIMMFPFDISYFETI
jgi:hypothetical protein